MIAILQMMTGTYTMQDRMETFDVRERDMGSLDHQEVESDSTDTVLQLPPVSVGKPGLCINGGASRVSPIAEKWTSGAEPDGETCFAMKRMPKAESSGCEGTKPPSKRNSYEEAWSKTLKPK